MKITLIFIFYSNLNVNRTVKNEFETKIDLKPLGPPRFLWCLPLSVSSCSDLPLLAPLHSALSLFRPLSKLYTPPPRSSSAPTFLCRHFSILIPPLPSNIFYFFFRSSLTPPPPSQSSFVFILWCFDFSSSDFKPREREWKRTLLLGEGGGS
jgi:hypothetical protein